MQISAVGNRVANIDADTKSDRLIWMLVGIKGRNLLLHLHRTAHRSVDAIETR